MPPPTDRLANAEAAARSAQELGAQQNPQAALYLQLATEENRRARSLMRNGDNEQANRVLMRSRADAELSVMLAKEGSARMAADQAQDSLRKARSTQMPSTGTQEGQPQPTP